MTNMNPIRLVLLPGLDGTGVLFRPLLDALPSDIQPIVVTYPPDKALGYDELLPLALKALPQGVPFVLLGESFGGPLALRIAATRPEGLRALILSASFVTCPLRLVPIWAAPLVRAFPLRALPELLQLKAFFGRHSTPRLRSLIREALSIVQHDVVAHRLREAIRVDVTPELATCDLPILYIQGRHDLVVPGGNLERILRIKPDVQHIQLPAPHMVLQTQPEAAANAINNFMLAAAGSTMK